MTNLLNFTINQLKEARITCKESESGLTETIYRLKEQRKTEVNYETIVFIADSLMVHIKQLKDVRNDIDTLDMIIRNKTLNN